MNRLMAIAALALALSACRGQPSTDPPIVPLRNMYNQPRYNPQASSAYYADGRSMRGHVPGTVAREMEVAPELALGLTADHTAYVAEVPNEAAAHFGGRRELVERGQGRYDIFCAPCHDRSGTGAGIIVQRGMQAPPTFHSERLRGIPDGQLFATISNGLRMMPAYEHSIPVHDRWAIVSYVRALQLSQASRSAEARP